MSDEGLAAERPPTEPTSTRVTESTGVGRLRRRRPLLLATALVVVLALVAGGLWLRRGDGPPNVLVIMTDDQTLESMRVLENVDRLIAQRGTTFERYYVATPNCCPSRAAFLSGRYPHNTGVRDNIPPLGGAKAFRPIEPATLPVWLQEQGYYTAHIGKYLNGWGNPDKPDFFDAGIAPPPGWTHWFGLIDPTTYSYFNYSVSDDGRRRDFGARPEDYQTDVLGQHVVDTIRAAEATGQPWFIDFAPLAPHVGRPRLLQAVPAPRHDGTLAGEVPPAPPSVSAEASQARDKPELVRQRVQQNPAARASIETDYQLELESLLAVDEWVERIHDTLVELGVLDETLVVFTSDNGAFHGEHGLVQKGFLYEEAVHVPLVIAGPGFEAGATSNALATSVDLAPTILNTAGLDAPSSLDGADLRGLGERGPPGGDRAVLLTNWYSFTPRSAAAIRTGDWVYVEWYDQAQERPRDRELYDLATDPHQLDNRADDPALRPIVDQLRPRLQALRSCAGDSCRQA